MVSRKWAITLQKLSYSHLNSIAIWSIIVDGEMGVENEFVVPGVAVDDGHVAERFGDTQDVNLAPTRRAVVKGLARKQQPVAHIVILIETSSQAILVGHEQFTMQGYHTQSQVPTAGDDKLGMLHRRLLRDNRSVGVRQAQTIGT